MTNSERRKILKAGGAALTVGLAGCIGPFQDGEGVPGTVDHNPDTGNGNGNGGTGTGIPEVDQYLSDANNYDGSVTDMTGEDGVTVEVGAGNGLAFGPAAIQVDPGTTVTWEWTGNGGPHNVIDEDGTFDSGEAVPDEGTTFEYTFEEEGAFRYFCNPHKGSGMKAAVIVGDVGGGGGGGNVPGNVADYLSDANNYDDSLEDMTGEDAVSVDVGAQQGLSFGPAAIQVDPGTTVTWEWTGNGGPHNVVHEEGAFDSGETVPDEGTTFEYTFEEEGAFLYFCRPHKGSGMKGAVVVGDVGGGGGGGGVPGEVEDHLSDANLYDGSVADMTGEGAVTVTNGANEPDYAFDPPAIRVDAGTEVTWEWASDVSHSVTHTEEAFNSETQSGADTTFSHTFEESGVYLYFCIPHRALGQKGAVIVE